MGVFRHTHFGQPTKAPRPLPDRRLPVPPAARPKPATLKPANPPKRKDE